MSYLKIIEPHDTNCNLDKVQCYCGEILLFGELDRIYDDHGIYAGRCCTYQCAEKHMGINLHYTRQDVAENGECLDDNY